MSGWLLWAIVVGVLIAVAVVALVVAASVRANRNAVEPPSDRQVGRREADPEPASASSSESAGDTWAQAIRAAAQATAPDVSTSSRQVLTRDALVNPDRTLDPNLWDNAPDGSESDEDADDASGARGAAGGGGLDAGFFDSLRAKRDGDHA